MPSKIILKKSSVASKVPVAGDLDFGELAINYTDSKLYFKKADGSIDAFTSSAAAAPVTSVGGYTGDVTATNLLDAIKTVDGAGSGLDADTLDGLSSASFYLASNPNGYTSNLGTVTSVGATSPVVSSGGTTPTISIPAATASVNGYMTAAYASKLDGIAAGATNVTNTNQLTNGAGYITSSGSITGSAGSTSLLTSPNGATVVAADSAMPGVGHSFIHTLAQGPGGNDGHTLGMTWANTTSIYGAQLWIDTDPTNTMAFRSRSSGGVWTGWNTVLHSSNYTSYSPSLTGSGASGTWGINITGNAATATSADQIDSWPFRNTGNNSGTNADTIESNGITYYTGGVTNFSGNATDGALYSQAYSSSWQHQIAGDYRSGQIAVRGKNSGTWQSWLKVLQENTWQGSKYFGSGGAIYGTIFYDANDSGYYIDPNSTANNALRMRGGAHFGPNTTWGASLYVGGDGRVGTSATVAVTNGNLHIDAQDGYSLYLNWYNTSNIYTQSNLGVGSSSASYRLHVHGTGYATSDFRAPIFYDSDNTGYYSDPNNSSRLNTVNADTLRSYNNIYLDNQYGSSIIGVYSSVRYQGVFSMGDAYKLPLDGTTTGNLYGLAWSHPNAGGIAGNLNTHGLLVLENGSFLAAVSGSIRSRDDMRSPIFYDSNDTGYYCNPNSSSRFSSTYTDNSYSYGWFRTFNNNGLYNETYGNHWYATSDAYWNLAGNNASNVGIIFRTGGHQGTARGYVYADNSNNIGFLNSAGSWRLRVVGDDYSLADGSSMRAQLYYDSNNTGYYADLNNTTYLYYLQSATTVRADSDRRLKENITPITSALSLVRQLQGCRYTRNDLADKTKVYIGMIAQDVLPIVPEVVSGSEAGKYSLGYAELVPVLNEAVKELDEIVSKQAAIIAKLEERLSKLLDD